MKRQIIVASLICILTFSEPAQTQPSPTIENNRDFPAPVLIEGQPIENRAPEKADDKPLFPQQTRAPYRSTTPFKVTTLTDKLHLPWSLAFLPDGALLIAEKEPGNLRILDQQGNLSAPLAGLDSLTEPGKLGLLDVVLDPSFARNHCIYFAFFERLAEGYSNTNIARARLDGTKIADVTVIFRAIPALPVKNFSMKQGGRIAIGHDHNLYVAIGDRDTGTPWDVAQKLDNHLGKTIRITSAGRPAPGNPFLTRKGALPEIWSSGHRSPEALALDPRTGRLWETEHGPRGGDELNLIEKGKNYGWPVITHGVDYPGTPIGAGITAKEGMEQPVYYWDPVIAPSGMAFYQGSLFPQWRNSLFVGALRGRMLDRLEMSGDKIIAEEPLLTNLHARIRDVRQGPDGAVYVLTEADSLLKLIPK